MTYFEREAKLKPLVEALERLEEQAGITRAIQRAKEGKPFLAWHQRGKRKPR